MVKKMFVEINTLGLALALVFHPTIFRGVSQTCHDIDHEIGQNSKYGDDVAFRKVLATNVVVPTGHATNRDLYHIR